MNSATAVLILIVIVLVLVILWVISNWKVFKKAGKPGWAFLVPFYNGWTLAKIGSRPAWWGLIASLAYGGGKLDSHGQSVSSTEIAITSSIFAISFVFYLVICVGVAKNFGKSKMFGLLLALLPFIGFPILAFGSSVYKPVKN